MDYNPWLSVCNILVKSLVSLCPTKGPLWMKRPWRQLCSQANLWNQCFPLTQPLTLACLNWIKIWGKNEKELQLNLIVGYIHWTWHITLGWIWLQRNMLMHSVIVMLRRSSEDRTLEKVMQTTDHLYKSRVWRYPCSLLVWIYAVPH